jgi:hypothetical protein
MDAPTFVAIWSKFSETKLGRPSLSQAKETPYCTEAGGLSRRMAPVSPLAVSEIGVPAGLTWRAHHAVAEALHLELANVASPSFAFALLTADRLVTLLLHRRLLRRVRRSRQRDERKHQQDHPHLSLQRFLRPPERACGRLCLILGTPNVKADTQPLRFPFLVDHPAGGH